MMPALSELTVQDIILPGFRLASSHAASLRPKVSNVRELHPTDVAYHSLSMADFLDSFTALDTLHLAGFYRDTTQTGALVPPLRKFSKQLVTFAIKFSHRDRSKNPCLNAMRALLEVCFPKLKTLTCELPADLVHPFAVLFGEQAQLPGLKTLVLKIDTSMSDVSALKAMFNAGGCRSPSSIHVGVAESIQHTKWTELRRPIGA